MSLGAAQIIAEGAATFSGVAGMSLNRARERGRVEGQTLEADEGARIMVSRIMVSVPHYCVPHYWSPII